MAHGMEGAAGECGGKGFRAWPWGLDWSTTLGTYGYMDTGCGDSASPTRRAKCDTCPMWPAPSGAICDSRRACGKRDHVQGSPESGEGKCAGRGGVIYTRQ